tara:strand:+ start:1453 stop:1968 length:516 start_codon:yes stop_codon:yes gene_type:complete
MLDFMQNLSTQDSIKTKQLLPDRFWIIEHNGSRIGTIQRHDENNFVVTGIDSSIAQMSKQEIEDQFNLFAPVQNIVEATKTEDTKKEIYGYPTKHTPFNAVLDVKHQIPLYSKSPNSNNLYAAGYYIVHFPKGWVKGFCPKLSTITQNQFQGPFKTVMEQRQAFSNVNKNR